MGRNLYDALTEGGDVDQPEPFTPAKMQNVSPNQRALPGMEHLAHPLARHLNDLQFVFQNTHSYDRDQSLMRPEAPLPKTHHELIAVHPDPEHYEIHGDAHNDVPGRAAGRLEWRGKESGYMNPGEIAWVGRYEPNTNDEIERNHEEGRWQLKKPLPETPGLMTDMFHAGHQINMGQETVPVHSQDRTPYGERWSRGVGHPALRPDHGDTGWKPPAGIHPYEREPRNLSKAQFSDNDQQHFPGMDRLTLANQHKTFLAARSAQEIEDMRKSGDAF